MPPIIHWDSVHQEWQVTDEATGQVLGAFSKLYEAERFVCSLGGEPATVLDLDGLEVES